MRGLTQPEPNVSATQETAVVRKAAREEISCACGCGRSFPASNRSRKYFDVRPGSSCRQRAWRSRWLRKRPAKANTGSPAPLQRISERVYTRRFIEPGCVRKALKVLAQTRPEFFVNLLAAVESPARARIELAG